MRHPWHDATLRQQTPDVCQSTTNAVSQLEITIMELNWIGIADLPSLFPFRPCNPHNILHPPAPLHPYHLHSITERKPHTNKDFVWMWDGKKQTEEKSTMIWSLWFVGNLNEWHRLKRQLSSKFGDETMFLILLNYSQALPFILSTFILQQGSCSVKSEVCSACMCSWNVWTGPCKELPYISFYID